MTKLIKKQSRIQIVGIALRNVLDKSVLVEVTRLKEHPLYKKRYQVSRKFLVQSDLEVKKGQKVIIQECRPISKRKAWQVVKIIDSSINRG